MGTGTSRVRIENGRALILEDGGTRALSLRPLSSDLMEWFMEGKKTGYESLSRGGGPASLFSRHLPVVATAGEDGLFTVRLAHKGVGFLPREEHLEEQISLYQGIHNRTRDLPRAETLKDRLGCLQRSVTDPTIWDPRLLGSLEIFAGGTFKNLSHTPSASLLFTDPGPGYRSFQLDCIVETAEPPDPRFEFLRLARGLFERDPFHVTQTAVHCAYFFWIVGIHDKTPHSVREGDAPHRI